MEDRFILRVTFFLILTLFTPYIDTSNSVIRPSMFNQDQINQRLRKKSMGYAEDTYLNFTELANKNGYSTEEHTVKTEDGYILTVFRILPKCNETTKSYPVLLVHGIFNSADTWVVPGTEIGLGYVLANNCYDAWAVNSRGNYYSRRHVRLDPNKDAEYWNFSFDENGNFDIPATIDYVLERTGYQKLFYIGHSQGAAQYFVMTSLRPTYNEKIVLAIQLAPVTSINNLNPITAIAAHNHKYIQTFLQSTGFNELLARDRLVHFLVEFLCVMAPRLCEFGLSVGTGYKQGTIPLKSIPATIGSFSGGSVKNLAHFAQIIVSGKFQRYDEGTEGNLLRYNSLEPPQYNISLSSSPVVLIAGQNDVLAPMKDVNTLASKLPNLVEKYVVPKPYWSHHNSIWGSSAPELVYPKILEHLSKFQVVYDKR